MEFDVNFLTANQEWMFVGDADKGDGFLEFVGIGDCGSHD
jgi:hypothetical protein